MIDDEQISIIASIREIDRIILEISDKQTPSSKSNCLDRRYFISMSDWLLEFRFWDL